MIIENDNLKLHPAIRQHGPNGRRDVRLLISGRDQH
jgi:hypothetical protein